LGRIAAIRSVAERLLPGRGAPAVSRMRSGGSTDVYRLRRGGDLLYLRFAEQDGESMAAEAWVHEELRRLGAAVPAVVAVGDGAELGRAFMVTTAVPGRSVPRLRPPDGVMEAAGRDLALIGSIPVDGLGFVRRDRPAPPLQGRDGGPPAVLAHGDFDHSHVFAAGGAYTGIIDFGEIRGAPPLYDVAHWALQSPPDALLAGYAQVVPLPDGHERVVAALSIEIGHAMLGRIAGRGNDRYERVLLTGIARAEAVLGQ
jgi:aminoglycoside phosphotransferase (APT) family kinase protein